jgi:hypothetical protein
MCGGHADELGYLVNELKKDFHEAQDQGYKFHFSRLIVLIKFFSWKIPEGATSLDIEPS